MLSQQEEIYVKGIIENSNKENYVCITNNPNNSYNSSYYDIICYLSNNQIEISSANIIVPNESIKIELDTKSPTSTNKLDSYKLTQVNSQLVSYNTKEFIYSNIEGYSDITKEYVNTNDNIVFYTQAICLILALTFLYRYVKNLMNVRNNVS